MSRLNIRVELVKEEKINEIYKQRFIVNDDININDNYEVDKKLEKEIVENQYIYIIIEKDREKIEKKILLKQCNKKKLVLKNLAYYQSEILKTFNINDIKYYLYCDKNSDLYITKNVNDVYRISQKIHHIVLGNKIILGGILTNTLGQKKELEDIYLGDELYGRVKRIFKKGKLRHIGLIIIDINDVIRYIIRYH